MWYFSDILEKGCENSGPYVATAAEFSTVTPKICVTLLAPKTLKWLLDFWNTFINLFERDYKEDNICTRWFKYDKL
jgi:hypothetical protein